MTARLVDLAQSATSSAKPVDKAPERLQQSPLPPTFRRGDNPALCPLGRGPGGRSLPPRNEAGGRGMPNLSAKLHDSSTNPLHPQPLHRRRFRACWRSG
jgi:hypothetical protein